MRLLKNGCELYFIPTLTLCPGLSIISHPTVAACMGLHFVVSLNVITPNVASIVIHVATQYLKELDDPHYIWYRYMVTKVAFSFSVWSDPGWTCLVSLLVRLATGL